MKKSIKTLLFIIFIAAIIIILVIFDFESLTEWNNILSLKERFVEKNYFLSILSLLGLYTLFSFLYLPIAPLSIISGVLFGFFFGSLFSFIGSAITMILSFVIARFFLHDFFDKVKSKIKLFDRILLKITEGGKNFILFARLFFVTPYNSLNVVSAISNIPFGIYSIYSVIGALPSCLFYAYCGSTLTKFTSMAEIKKNGLILAFVSIVFFLVINLFKKVILKKKIDTDDIKD